MKGIGRGRIPAVNAVHGESRAVRRAKAAVTSHQVTDGTYSILNANNKATGARRCPQTIGGADGILCSELYICNVFPVSSVSSVRCVRQLIFNQR